MSNARKALFVPQNAEANQDRSIDLDKLLTYGKKVSKKLIEQAELLDDVYDQLHSKLKEIEEDKWMYESS